MNSKKILIFGVFDGVHEGHIHFINEAKMQGDHLVAIVARDSIVEKLKGTTPLYNEVERIKNLLEIPEVDFVLLGDGELGTYHVLREVKPDVVFLGYDQKKLKEDLTEKIKSGELRDIEITVGKSHKGDELHSSILRK